MKLSFVAPITLAITLAIGGFSSGQVQNRVPDPAGTARARPWTDASLSADQRAEMVLREMTLDEKISMVHGQGMPWGDPTPNYHLSNGGAGFVLGIARLGIPIIQMSDAAYGVRSSASNGRYSTALPSNLGLAATWDSQLACRYGELIGRELRAQGYNMTLGGGVNITREPRNGRTFEYHGEDPILAGVMVGNRIKCEQAQNVIGNIKHFTLNDQESGRELVDARIDRRSLRETDLLAFEVGLDIGKPAAVMCSFNGINGDYACENKYLLTDVLRREWGFRGFVLSDWGGTHSTEKASAAGLDNEQPLPVFFGAKLKHAVQAGWVPKAELDDHVRRILRAEFVSGIVDNPVRKSVVDVERGFEVAQSIAEQSIVLLKNGEGLLPLDRAKLHKIAVIGPHADTGMVSGGGSAQVDGPGHGPTKEDEEVWFPTSPLKAVTEKTPGTIATFDSGADPASAAAMARSADVAIIFAYQWMREGRDLPNLSLPGNQDEMIAAVAAANPHTIVVLETGTAVLMPWIDKVSGIIEAWYPGIKGADAVSNVLFGDVNPSGKLPMTFPLSEADLPHPQLALPPAGMPVDRAAAPAKAEGFAFSVQYDEGLKVGYKWYEANNKEVLFPFGHGLSYTTYQYSDLDVKYGEETTVDFTLQNTGDRYGAEIAQLYAVLPAAAGEPFKRLVGWSKVALEPGEAKKVTITVPSKYLSIYDDQRTDVWKIVPGPYTFMVGTSSTELPLSEQVSIQ